MTMKLSSSAFPQNGSIPTAHTCEGANTPPTLEWIGVPDGAKSLVLIVDDPDAPDPKAPKLTYVHWVLYDIPVAASGLGAGEPLPQGTQEGLNEEGERGYTGPCPPVGRHRYFFKLSALDTMLGDLGNATKDVVERAMRDHVVAHAELVGTYEKTGAGAKSKARSYSTT
jgi:Raf kinase inhibitor-like YbhB/YbcL family protein